MGRARGPIHEIDLTVNRERQQRTVAARQLLVHFLRDELWLRGPKIGCDTGHCGACTVSFNGKPIKSCIMLAVQADGAEIETAESLASLSGDLNSLQESFRTHHALQCGYCTSGVLMSAQFLLERNSSPTEDDVRKAIRGNICRCTGYMNIVKAIQAAAEEVSA